MYLSASNRMLISSGLNNKENLICDIKKGLQLGDLQGWPIQAFNAQIKGSDLFHLFTWLSSGRGLSFPHSFTMAVTVPTVIPRKTAVHGRGGCFLDVSFLEMGRLFPAVDPGFLLLYNVHFAFFLLLQLKLRFST